MADNVLVVTDTSIVSVPLGVVDVTPPFVQPVIVTGSVTVVQPIEITQPVNVILSPSSLTIGVVDQGLPGVLPWPVSGTFTFAPSTSATTVAEVITTSPNVVLGTNLARKGFAIQATNQIVFVKLDSTVSTALYSYELPKKGILEVENYCGPVSVVDASGSTIVMVTEKV